MVMTVGPTNPQPFGTLAPVRSDTLPENTRYKDDGCDASPSCLECPLTLCRYDDPSWLQNASRRTRDNEIFQLREERVPIAVIANKFGISTRTVHRIVQRGGAAPVTVAEEDDGPVISLSELAERSLFRERIPFPQLVFNDAKRFGVN
ncbi:helix-turn-helix domain-containing protein [Dehalococcoides mccartyi]|nr:helix-turn-helix domain-containing protein [Dehalococcoides mccartyi]